MNRICIEKCNIALDDAKYGIIFVMSKFLTKKMMHKAQYLVYFITSGVDSRCYFFRNLD